MTGQGIGQILVYAVVLVALGYPLGIWMARVYTAERLPAARLERGFLPPRRRRPRAGLEGLRRRPFSSSASSFFGLLYLIQRIQGHLFLNPDGLKGVPAHISLNTAASFVTNTNWQYYGGEYTMSYLTQMAGLAVQNFVSAGGRDGGARGGRARPLAALPRRARQLLAGPLPLAASTSSCRSP